MPNKKSEGFHVVEVVLIVGFLALIGFIGYRVWQNRQAANKIQATTQAEVPAIKTATDLDTASSFVDQQDTSADTSDLTKLEQELNSL